MTMASFGVGQIWATPLTDASGAAIVVPTPVQIGIVQDVKLDVSYELKKLYGSRQFAEFIGRGQGSVTGSLTAAKISAAALNLVMAGTTTSAFMDATDVTAVIPATPFTVTPAIPNAGTWSADLGVINLTTGRAMNRVASAPATGQYSVAAGVYTFAAADTSNTVTISVKYTATVIGSQKTVVSNINMGTAPTFGVDWNIDYQGKIITYTLPCVTFSKFSFATKANDFTIPALDFEAVMDQTSQSVMTYYASE